MAESVNPVPIETASLQDIMPVIASWGDVVLDQDGSANQAGEGASGPVNSASYTYDHRGRLVKEMRTVDGGTYTTEFNYDGADRLKTVTYPTGETVTQQYSTRGLPVYPCG